MTKKFDINIELLKKTKEKGHCLCNLGITCPCDDFLNKTECKCGVYKKIKAKNKKKHMHTLRKDMIGINSVLRCDCGLIYTWDIDREQYEEECYSIP